METAAIYNRLGEWLKLRQDMQIWRGGEQERLISEIELPRLEPRPARVR